MKKLKRYYKTLKFSPMSTIPDAADRSRDTEDQEAVDAWRARFQMPVGIVLRCRTPGLPYGYILVGDNTGGERTHGCTCCSINWSDLLHNYDGWAWAFPDVKGK